MLQYPIAGNPKLEGDFILRPTVNWQARQLEPVMVVESIKGEGFQQGTYEIRPPSLPLPDAFLSLSEDQQKEMLPFIEHFIRENMLKMR
jgi:hypothetical protein